MTDQILFNRLVYVDSLKAAGIAEGEARAYADAFEASLRLSATARADLRDLKTDIGNLHAGVRVMDVKIRALLAITVLSLIKLFWQ